MNIETINKTAEIAVAIKKEAVRSDSMSGIMGEAYKKLWEYITQQGK